MAKLMPAMVFLLFTAVACQNSRGVQGEWMSVVGNSGLKYDVMVNSCRSVLAGNTYVVSVTYSVRNSGKTSFPVTWDTKAVEDADGRKWLAKWGSNQVVQPLETKTLEANFELPSAAKMDGICWGLARVEKTNDRVELNQEAKLVYRIRLKPERG